MCNDFEIISNELIKKQVKKAQKSPRLRTNYNFHKLSDKVQRFLNIVEPHSYIPPHRHHNPPKNETFIVLKGKIMFFIFDDEGNISDNIVLNANDNNIGIDIKAGTWHTFIALESTAVVFEIKDGPYDPDTDKAFAPFAPLENSEQAKTYINILYEKSRGVI